MSTNIPVINLRELKRSQTLGALDNACRNWGVFQLVAHGIDSGLIARLFEGMHAFFALPSGTKREILRTRENPWGYYDQELTANTLDCKQVFDYGPADGEHLRPQWPAQLPHFKAAVLEYYAACEQLSLVILGAIAGNLGVSPSLLARSFQPSHTSFLRLNYFPVQPHLTGGDGRVAGDAALGINAHTDAGAVTVLSVDPTPGLEVWHDNQWLPLAASEGALLVNIGDVVQVWSNERYRAPLHRVKASEGGQRFSTPFFLNPAYGANYAPLHSTVDDTHPARYRTINWGEFRELRALGDYGDYGEEVQLNHYRIGG